MTADGSVADGSAADRAAAVRWGWIRTPVGTLSFAVDAGGVCGVAFGPVESAVPLDGAGQAVPAQLSVVAGQLGEFFAGSRTDFTLPLSVRRGSDFERAVWAQLSLIPYGETRTYGQIAAAVGDPGAARAVGTACNRNPIAVIVPCHRVVGADGKLVGFGGGLDNKRVLLELEARVAMQRDWLG